MFLNETIILVDLDHFKFYSNCFFIDFTVSGSFFEHYPRHRRLISLNKRNTGELNKEFNLRHDWNSLLTHKEDNLKFTDYSNENFPQADLLVDYLNDFKRKFNLNLKYNTKISNIKCINTNLNSIRKNCKFEMNDQYLHKYSCRLFQSLLKQ